MRHLLRLLIIAVPALLTLGVSPASAGLSTWTGLTGLNDASGASWVREYATGLLPTTIYAATEDDGVWRSTNDGVDVERLQRRPDTEPGAMHVRTVYTQRHRRCTRARPRACSSRSAAAPSSRWRRVRGRPEEPEEAQRAVQALYSVTGGPMLAGVASGGVYSAPTTAARPGSAARARATAWRASETVWSIGEFDPGRPVRGDRAAASIARSTPARPGRWPAMASPARPCACSPTRRRRTSTTRPATTASSARSTPASRGRTSTARSATRSAGQVRALQADDRRRRDAPLRRHRERRVRRHDRPRPVPR